MDKMTILNNIGGDDTGGISVTACYNVTLSNSIFIENEGQNYSQGGGLTVQESQEIDIIDCVLKKNKVKYQGGGVFLVKNENVRLNKMLITENLSLNHQGGGLFIEQGKNIHLKHVEIYNNYG